MCGVLEDGIWARTAEVCRGWYVVLSKLLGLEAYPIDSSNYQILRAAGLADPIILRLLE